MINKKENKNNRDEIIDLIQAIDYYDETENKHIKNTIDWINSGVEIFRIEKPATPIKHLVCYAVLYDTKKQKILLLEHRQSGLILPSGGHVEKGEAPYKAVQRELLEELGIKAEYILKNWKLPFFVTQAETVGNKTGGHIDVTLWYLLNSKEQIKTDSQDFEREFEKFKWYAIEDILKIPINMLDINMHRFVKKIKKYF